MPHPLFSHTLPFKLPEFIITERAITGTTTLTKMEEIVWVDSSGGGFTLTLPLLRTVGRGRQVYIIKTQTPGIVTVAAQGSDVIGFAGAASVPLNAVDNFVHLVSDGTTRWFIL